MKKKILFAIFIIIIFVSATHGNEDEEEKTSFAVFYPVIFASPETGFAAGGAVLFITNLQPNNPEIKPNQTNILAYYTQKKQFKIDGNTERYYRKNDVKLYLSANYSRFPCKLWGIGKNTTVEMEEEYTQVELTVNGDVMTEIFRHIFIGPYYRFSHFGITERESNGVLDNGTICGSDGSNISGVGMNFIFDSRDNILFPFSGQLFQLKYVIYRKAFGGSTDFTQTEFDFRNYVCLFEDNVFASQVKFVKSNGDVPFQVFPKLGGSTVMRGYYEGRFRDKNYLAIQGEYRMPLFWRVGCVFFGGMGHVASDLKDLSVKDLRTSGGVGIRYSMIEGQFVNLRFDVGFCEEGYAYYVNYREAF
jgi:hypothetical protein